MHKYIWKPAWWVFKHKTKGIFTNTPYSMFENKICRDYRDGRVTKEQLDQCSTCDLNAVINDGLSEASKAQLVGKTLRPAHALSRAVACPRRTASLSDEEALLFMKGREIPFEGEEGWTLVKAGPYPLGWGKQSKGVLKNHIPRGIRLPDA